MTVNKDSDTRLSSGKFSGSEAKEIAPGDLVRLKSGSPQMVVSALQINLAACVWMDGSTVYRDMFQVAALEMVKP